MASSSIVLASKGMGAVKRFWPYILVTIFVISMIPMAMMSMFTMFLMPGVDDDVLTGYVSVANELSIDWQEYVALLMVTCDNDFSLVTPEVGNQVALDLITLEEKIYKWVEREGDASSMNAPYKEKVLSKTNHYKGSEAIIEFLESQGYENILSMNITSFISLVSEVSQKSSSRKVVIKTRDYQEPLALLDEEKQAWFLQMFEADSLFNAFGHIYGGTPKSGILVYDGQMNFVAVGDGFFEWPTPNLSTITSFFGSRWGRPHVGIDIAGSTPSVTHGSPVIASADGLVRVSTKKSGAAGHYVAIAHQSEDGINLVTRYMHLSTIFVSVGEDVKKGDVIGLVGNTGRVVSAYSGPYAGSHLHFDISSNGKYIDPLLFFKNR